MFFVRVFTYLNTPRICVLLVRSNISANGKSGWKYVKGLFFSNDDKNYSSPWIFLRGEGVAKTTGGKYKVLLLRVRSQCCVHSVINFRQAAAVQFDIWDIS